MKVTKLMELITEAQTMKAQMSKLKTDPKVKRYLALEEERKALHKTIGQHVERYNVDPTTYKPLGLVERGNSWVKVKDVSTLAEKYPKFRDVIMGLINTSKSYYTK